MHVLANDSVLREGGLVKEIDIFLNKMGCVFYILYTFGCAFW